MADIYDFTPEQQASLGVAPSGPGAVPPTTAGEPFPANAGPQVPKWWKSGRRFALGAAALGKVAGVDQLVSGIGDTITNGPNVGNAIRTGVGVASLFNPYARALAGGMSIANHLIPDAAYNYGLNKLGLLPQPTNIQGPETTKFLSAGGKVPAYGAVPPIQSVPGVTGGADVEDAALGTPQNMTPIRTDLDAGQILRENFTPGGPGTGAISVNGGPARTIDTRASYGAVRPEAAVADPNDPTGIGAIARLRQVAGDNALATARATAQARALAAQGTYLRGTAAQGSANLSAAMAAEYLKQNPGDIAGAAAIFHGRTQTGAYSIPIGGLPTIVGQPAYRLNRATGEIELVTPKPTARTASAADFKADVARLGSKEAVLREYARRNITPPKE